MKVALTFDAEFPDKPGSSLDNLYAILAELEVAQVDATFFVQGRWADAYPEAAQEIASYDGSGPCHAIGSHGYFHAPTTFLTPSAFRQDVMKAQDSILAATGVDPRPLYRHPFGISAHALDLVNIGYKQVGWSVAGEDWQATQNEIINNVLTPLTNGEGFAHSAPDSPAIVLLHTWPDETPRALYHILKELLARDTEFVTLGKDVRVRSSAL